MNHTVSRVIGGQQRIAEKSTAKAAPFQPLTAASMNRLCRSGGEINSASRPDYLLALDAGRALTIPATFLKGVGLEEKNE